MDIYLKDDKVMGIIKTLPSANGTLLKDAIINNLSINFTLRALSDDEGIKKIITYDAIIFEN